MLPPTKLLAPEISGTYQLLQLLNNFIKQYSPDVKLPQDQQAFALIKDGLRDIEANLDEYFIHND
jgi:hypothetical protein